MEFLPLFFSLLSTPFPFSSLLLEGWGGGCSYCGTFVRQPVAEAEPRSDLWEHLHDPKPRNMFPITPGVVAALQLERRWSDGFCGADNLCEPII